MASEVPVVEGEPVLAGTDAAETTSGALLETPQPCAVCFDSTELILMPCCGRAEATTRFCQPCIECICQMAPGGFGKCPKCRSTLAIESGKIVTAEARGKCRMCNQGNKVIVEGGLCDACLYGSRYVLKYECDRCHRSQRIPHPMWRYCATPDAFSGATWACHQGCGGYTHWRVVPADLPRVPAQDRPASWGTDDWLREVRTRRRQEASQPAQPAGDHHAASSSRCMIM